MRFSILFAALLLAGCLKEQTYAVKFIKPDGEGYRLTVVRSMCKPTLVACDGVVVLRVVGDQDYLVPSGWMVEVESRAEQE